MHSLTLLAAAAAAAPVMAAFSSPLLLNKRQETGCLPGDKICGEGCIPVTWECCPRQDGGCPPLSYCDIGDNGETGCCPDGLTCTGDGGVSTDYNTLTSTIWSTIDDPTTSTIVEEDTTTYSASLPILTLTTTTEAEVPVEPTSETVPPVDLPSPIPTGNGTTTASPVPVPTAGAVAAHGLAGNLVGGIAAGAAMLLM